MKASRLYLGEIDKASRSKTVAQLLALTGGLSGLNGALPTNGRCEDLDFHLGDMLKLDQRPRHCRASSQALLRGTACRD